jgi:hypothetical protein
MGVCSVCNFGLRNAIGNHGTGNGPVYESTMRGKRGLEQGWKCEIAKSDPEFVRHGCGVNCFVSSALLWPCT